MPFVYWLAQTETLCLGVHKEKAKGKRLFKRGIVHRKQIIQGITLCLISTIFGTM